MPAHAGIAAVGAGEPAFGERVIALDVLAQGGHEELMAGRALVIAGLGIQNGRCADAGGRRQEGQHHHRDAGRDRQRQGRGDRDQGGDRHHSNADGDHGKGKALFVLLILFDKVHHVFLRFLLIVRWGDLLACEKVVDRDAQRPAQGQHQGNVGQALAGITYLKILVSFNQFCR